MTITSAITGLVEACQYGRSGHCAAGDHGRCAHRPGGAHEHGCESPAAMRTIRARRPDPGSWLVVGPDLWLQCRVCGRRHGHVWRCSCDYHLLPPVEAPRVPVQLAMDWGGS
jgi:hypothetical protein